MRIVSLLPSATELLFAIGAGDQVVAVTHECDFPAAARGLPAVTRDLLDHAGKAPAAIDRHITESVHRGSSIYALDEAALRSLRPDLIVTQELCDVCAVAYTDVAAAVRRLPGDIEVLSLEPGSLDEIADSAVRLGDTVGRRSEAVALRGSMRERIDAVARAAPDGRRPATVCIEWTDPIMVGGHWVPEMVGLAGGRDPLGLPGQPSRYVDWEEIVQASPEVMVLMPCGYDLPRTLALATEVTRRPGFDDLPCARTGRVAAVDGSSYFNRPGPRIVDGLEMLAAILASEPGQPLPPGAAWVGVRG